MRHHLFCWFGCRVDHGKYSIEWEWEWAAKGGENHEYAGSDNLDEDIVRLKEKGYQFLSEEPSLGAHNTRVIFIHPKSCDGVLIEINEYPEGHH